MCLRVNENETSNRDGCSDSEAVSGQEQVRRACSQRNDYPSPDDISIVGSRGNSLQERLVPQDLHLLALVKGEEHYVFLYEEEAKSELIQTLREWAADPRLSFSWFDAAVLTARLQSLDDGCRASSAQRRQ